MQTKITQNLKSIILALTLVLGVSYVSAAWTNPPANPPSCPSSIEGCNTPLNVGSTSQDKAGPLRLNTSTTAPAANGLHVWGNSILYGNVGIGTSTPTATLSVFEPLNSSKDVFRVSARLAESNGARNSTVFTVASNGNVGIGGTLTAPTSKLSFGTSLLDENQKLALYEAEGGADLYGFGISSRKIDIYAAGIQVMTIKAPISANSPETGAVGIGTTSPAAGYRLHVEGDALADDFCLPPAGVGYPYKCLSNISAPACSFDGTWSYNDDGGGNDFAITCRNNRITGWCGAAAVSRGYHPGVYICETHRD